MLYIERNQRKKQCVDNILRLSRSNKVDTSEYRNYVKSYWDILMEDVASGKTLTKSEMAFVRSNVRLLDAMPRDKQDSVKSKLEDMGVIDKVITEIKTYDELYPSSDINDKVSESVKKLKDSYVYLKPGIKLCDKLIDYIRNLRFTVTTTVKATPSVNTMPTNTQPKNKTQEPILDR